MCRTIADPAENRRTPSLVLFAERHERLAKMTSSSEFAHTSMPAHRSLAAYRTYQGMTIAAMIVLLGTLWAF